MTAAVPASLATFVVGVATAIISLWNAVHSYRGTRISNVINTVTRQGIEWMEKVEMMSRPIVAHLHLVRFET